VTPQDIDQVEQVLKDFAAAWRQLDGVAIAECFGEDPRVTVIGTDSGEYTIGMNAYRSGWAAGTYPLSATRFDWEDPPVVRGEGGVAWSHGIIAYDLTLKSQEVIRGRMWISTVLQRTEEASQNPWKIKHLHASYA